MIQGEGTSIYSPKALALGTDLMHLLFDLGPDLFFRYPEMFLNRGLPFPTCLGEDAQLAYYDATLQDVLVLPGAGKGIRFGEEISPGVFLVVKDFKVWVYDSHNETTCLLSADVPGLAIFGMPDGFSNVYVLSAQTPEEALLGVGKLYRVPALYPAAAPELIKGIAAQAATTSRNSETVDPKVLDQVNAMLAKPREIPEEALEKQGTSFFQSLAFPKCPWPPLIGSEDLSKVNEWAALHGGVQFFFVMPRGDKLVFTTGTGGLYLYCLATPSILKLETGGKKAAFCSIDGLFGRYVSWEDPDTREVYVLDLITGNIDPVPFLNCFLKNEEVLRVIPFFYRVDPFHLYLYVFLTDGTTRFYNYHLPTEELLNLTLINSLLDHPPCCREP